MPEPMAIETQTGGGCVGGAVSCCLPKPAQQVSTCKFYQYFVYYTCTHDRGGLSPARLAARPDYRNQEAAMSPYEIVMLAITGIKIVIDIILRLRRRRIEDEE